MASVEQHRESRLHAGNASPGPAKIAGFHFRRRRRMVRGHHVDFAAQKFRPQVCSVRTLSRKGGAHLAIAPSRSTSSSVKDR